MADYWQGRRVAVTGATGFVGHHLVQLLARRGARVQALVRRQPGPNWPAQVQTCQVALDDPKALAAACAGCEYLFHLAAAVDFDADWARFWQINVAYTRNLVAAARQVSLRRLVFTSSIVAIGASQHPCPLDETAAWNLEKLAIPYVTTKRRAEELVLQEGQRGLDVVVVNPACVIGPDDWRGSEFGTLCKRIWGGRIPIYFGGGSNFVDVRDVALGHLLAAEKGVSGQRYILGGCNLTQAQFFAELARVASRPLFRLRLPRLVGLLGARVAQHLRRPNRRAYLTVPQARLFGWFFFYQSHKARRELGFQPRAWEQTLADTHDFWMGRSAA